MSGNSNMESIKPFHGDAANRTLRVFRFLSRFPFGKFIYSKLVNFYAPYTGTIRAVVTDLIPGRCTTEMKDRRSIQNHLRTVHAIALCNLCEMTMGLMVDATIPPHLRWIPRGMTVHYIKKACGKLSGRSWIDPDALAPGDQTVPVEIHDMSGDIVVRADIMLSVSRRPDRDLRVS
jgi:acyl-coenzyme A thioesterase PaaI-like protein